MHVRILQPNRAGDARWGYLDKFAANPSLPRALALTVLAVIAVLPALRLGSPGIAPRAVRVRSYGSPVDLLPPPHSSPLPMPAPRAQVPPVTAGRIRPVPPVFDAATWVESAPDGGAVTAADASGAASGSDAVASPGEGAVAWPDPDEFVPVEHEASLVTMPAPSYPELAREAGAEGTVLVRVLVGEDGFVHRALVLQGVLGLDDAALAAAREAVFRAARQQERPVAVWVVIPIEFRLRE